MRSINRLNEEIARWAFEILYKENTSWVIAFTNPTAGPWKTIKASSLRNGNVGQVYRFILEEDRPDIIMYNDELQAVIIVEAKDSLIKLIDRSQAIKSAAVVVKLANLLRNATTNNFWRGRENYKVILGLLWGATDYPETITAKEQLYDYYHQIVEGEEGVYTDLIIGLETLFSNESLACSAFYKNYGNSEALGERIINSLIEESLEST